MAKRYEEEQEYLDLRTGLICSVIANVNRSRNSKVFKPQDFMPQRKTAKTRVPEKQTPEELVIALKMITAAHGGQVVEMESDG